MADISVKWILATKYFLLQIQMIMIVVRIKNNNSALLRRIITNPYLLFIYLFYLCRLQDVLKAVIKSAG